MEHATLGETDSSTSEAAKPMTDSISDYLWIVVGALVFFGVPVANAIIAFRAQIATAERVEAAEKRADESPEKSKFAWDLARITLESYFDRNLRQVSAIFWLSVAAMLIGVGIIVWGITIAVGAKDNNATQLAAIITGASGVITELIGATFLVLYRSTMQQANEYTRTLERINSVGMAMQVLDTIPDGDIVTSAKNNTKADLVMILVSQSYEITKPKQLSAITGILGTKRKSRADTNIGTPSSPVGDEPNLRSLQE
jgi:nitrate reductase gamma subunit